MRCRCCNCGIDVKTRKKYILCEYCRKVENIRYGTNSIEQGMTITGIEQAIKEYCGMED